MSGITTLTLQGRTAMHVVATTDRRGAETFAVRLVGALGAQGWVGTVQALAPGLTGGLDVPTLGPSRYHPETLARLRQRALEAEVVVAHGSSTLPAVAAATAGSGIPFVYRSIGDPRAWVTTRIRRARVRVAVARARAVVALWGAAAVTWHELLGVPAERLVVIPNACPVAEFTPASGDVKAHARRDLGLPPNVALALCLGSLTPEKRLDVAVRAVALSPGVHLAIVGQGRGRAALASLVEEVAPGRVHLLGQLADPGVALAAADVVVISSDTEGQPAVAIEAGLSGLPVVATRVGGLAEVVEEGLTGLLVPPGDPVALAKAIAVSQLDASALGRAGRIRCVARFDLEVVARAWGDLLDTVVGQVPGQPDTRHLC
jgi:glycosyltransferase involved in cell wall biosynthesis